MTSNELLSSLEKDVQSIIRKVQTEFVPLGEEMLNWKERPDRWSILECLEHLNKYSQFYNTELTKAIDSAQRESGTVESKSTWLGRKFIRMMHPDNSAKQKTFARMNPSQGTLDGTTIERFLKHQEDLLKLIHKSGIVNINRNYVPVEFMKLLKMNLGDAFQFVIVHERRHIEQAGKVKATLHMLNTPALKI